MSKKKKESFFWVSYSDLMTSLFFIMLILFVMAIGAANGYYKNMMKSKQATEKELQTIKDLQTAVNKLDKTYFVEDKAHKRWVLKRQIAFPAGQATMPQQYKPYLIEVGNSLLQLLNDLRKMKNQPKYKNLDVTYLVVIEGMASKDKYPNNDALSYGRALSLYYLWRNNGISFEDSECDVQISGSGIRGFGRYNADGTEPDEETKNQRIIIQIVPKIGNINTIKNGK
jgi:flagellar basal body-associated protein FliL